MNRVVTSRSFTRVRIAAVLCALVASGAGAQSLVYGGLTGMVYDESGRPVMDAEVQVLDRLSGARREIITGRDGAITVSFLTPSTYDIRVEALGYVPMLYQTVVVRSGVANQLRVKLRRAAPPVTVVDTVRSGPARPIAMDWLRERGYSALAGGQRTAHDASSLSVISDDGSVEGLPWRLTDAVVDGAMVDGSGIGGYGGRTAMVLPLPIEALSSAVAGGLDYDTEIGGSGVGLMTRSRRGGDATQVSGTMYGGTFDRGGVLRMGGPVQRDTAHAILGIDYQYAEIPRAAAVGVGDAEGQAILNTARDDFGFALGAHALATPVITERGGAYVRLDWDAADRFAISLRASGTRVLSSDPAFADGRATGIGSHLEATTMHASVNVRARFTRRMTGEFRIGGGLLSAESSAPGLPSTSFAGRGLVLGASAEEPLADRQTSPRVNALLHFDLGRHRLKFGALLGAQQVETEGAGRAGSSFRFGDAADFAALLGAYRSVTGPTRSGTFRMSERALIVQDAWRVADGFDLTFGVRLDKNRIPAGDLAENGAWVAASGLDSLSVQESSSGLAPRVGLRWELGDRREWTITGGAGVFHDLPDHLMIGEALARDVGQPVRAGAGTLSSWPLSPNFASAPTVGTTLSLLGPEFQGARTRRAELSIARSTGGWSAYVKGIYRNTDLLGRRRDLNLRTATGARDQYGRVLYGGLQQLGTLLVAAPGTNRRFAGFETVDALEATGFSEYRAAIFGLERVRSAGFSVGFEYAYSQTIDNLVAGGGGGLNPVLSGTVSEWSEGIADTDAPHRLLAGAEWALPPSGTVRFGVVYRLRSGLPFTPTFRDGVDASADGAPGGDPAFVDPGLPGMDAVLAEWDCLQADVGTFARRNGCQGELMHRLDLRAVVRLRTLSRGTVDLVVDVLDVTGVARPVVDRALLLVDRTGTITTDAITGATVVPLIVNPGFGGALADRAIGPLLRLAVRVNR